MGSIFNDTTQDKHSPAGSRVVQPPLPFDSPSRHGLHRSSSHGGGDFKRGHFARSCPQTEMERLKARYLKEKSPSISHNSSLSSIDVSGLQQADTQLHVKSYDSDEDDDVVSPINDFSSDFFSPPGLRIGHPHVAGSTDSCGIDSTVRRGLHRTTSYSDGGVVLRQDNFARSCPQTEMERLKAEYLKEKSSFLSHDSSQGSIDVGGLQEQQQHHQNTQHYQHQNQHIRRYDSEEDDDVLLLNFNSPLNDKSRDKLSPAGSRVVQQPLSGGRDNFGLDSPIRRGPQQTSTPGGGGDFKQDLFAQSCPQTEMERLKAHYMKEKMSNAPFESHLFGNRHLQHSNSYSGHSFFNSGPSATEHHSIQPLSYKGNSVISSGRNDYFSPDPKLGNSRKNACMSTKDKAHSSNNRENKDFSNDLGVFSLDSRGIFSENVPSSRRELVFECIRGCKAQIILLSNTGLSTEDQLQVVRAEVKTFFPCESAMWASFSGGQTSDKSVPDDIGSGCNSIGRGVIILVLGPLAPRTGWIKSDSAGCVISASARIKPNLPVLTFAACDIGGVVIDKQIQHSSLLFLQDLIQAEYEKDNIIVMGGNLSGDICKPPSDSSCSMTAAICEWIGSKGVNSSVICNSSVPTGKSGLFPEDVLVCQKKKAMTILGVEVSDNPLKDVAVGTFPSLIKLNISGWPKKSFTVQLKFKSAQKVDPAQHNADKSKWNKKGDIGSRKNVTNIVTSCAQSQPSDSRSKLKSDLHEWRKNLQDFSHNLQGILHANIDNGVRFNCLQQLLTDVLNRAHSNPARIDSPGFANALYLTRISALLALPESEFLTKSSAIEQIIASWNAAVSLSITSADALP